MRSNIFITNINEWIEAYAQLVNARAFFGIEPIVNPVFASC